ncbi:MAG: enhanced serine sensitivity protein SseB [Oscillospiraceae bacterium]|nr:enhanced serine sensitivity protein SseB [Oscillospiraceae bacterium]
MEYELHTNEKLDKQPISELFAKRKTINKDDEAAMTELTSQIIAELVMNTTFIAPVQLGESSGDEQAVTFRLIQSPQGVRYFPVFTSSEDLETWEELGKTDTVHMTYDGYAELIKNNDAMGGIAVNPFSDNWMVDRRLVLQWYERKSLILNGYASHTITSDSRYEFIELSSDELRDKLIAAAKNQPKIKTIRLRGINLEGRDGFIAVVDVEGDRSGVFQELGNAARDLLGDKQLHIVLFDSDFGKLAAEGVEPIYSK